MLAASSGKYANENGSLVLNRRVLLLQAPERIVVVKSPSLLPSYVYE
jgi:hypothetical protein